ncbi:30S ribosomal protein S1 chloroplastic [Bienertia sinuspersici]
MLNLNVSSLGVGSLTSLCFHSHIIANDLTTNSCSFSYNHIPFTNSSFLSFNRKSGVCRYPLYAAQINASSSEAKVDDNLDTSSLPPVAEPPRPIRSPADWEAAKKYKETGFIYEGRVEGFNNGGLLVRFYSLVGFLPFPQLSPCYSCEEPKKTIQHIARGLVGSAIHMKVIEVDEERKKLIFSEKEATWTKYSEKIREGEIFEARVGMVEDYGAFLHMRFPDGKYHLTGLVHISEVSWDYVQDVRDVLTEGDIVRAKVVNIDREKSRITLSIRQLEEDPLLETLDKVIPQDGPTNPSSMSTSESYDIEPLPGLAEIFEELLKEDGINEVKIRRQGFEKRVVSQDLQLWLSNVQEIQMTTTLDQEGIKKALQRVLERVP